MPLPSVTNPLGTPFIELQSVDSTNNYALARIHEGMAQHGTCFFAREQTAGKGQRGKFWATETDANLTISIVLKPDFLQSFQQFQLSAAVAVATQHFFSNYGGSQTKIKWPNDLYWKEKKAGGILIENIIRNQELGIGIWEWAVLGIGININQTTFPGNLPNPVSLKQITGQHFDTLQSARDLCQSVDHFYKKLMSEGFDPILEAYNQFLYKKNETVKLKKNTRSFETVIKGVSETGQLITRHAIEERFDFGEIEWVK